ncbi:MAG: PEGA domain-containing protein [Treponema sp.]|nr:PEGA domain-containing protein [Treponema sp.]
MNRKITGFTAFLLVSVFLAGCTMTTKITIETDVPGAQVNLDGKIIGVTPIENYKVKNRIFKEYPVLLTKEGYKPTYSKLKTESKLASMIGSILIIPAIWMEGPQKLQYFVMEPEGQK